VTRGGKIYFANPFFRTKYTEEFLAEMVEALFYKLEGLGF
jgi:hypothetical protein